MQCKWSKKEILGHLSDSALNNLHRFVRVQYEDQDALPSARAAVYCVVNACNVRCTVRSNEGREFRELMWLAEPLQKRLTGYGIPSRLVVTEVAVAGWCQKWPWTDRHRDSPGVAKRILSQKKEC